MSINKLIPSVKVPYEIVKGSFEKRQHKSEILTEKLFKNINESIKDNYSIFSYEELQKHIDNILPDKNFKVIIQNMPKSINCDGICEVLYNINGDIKTISISLDGIGNTIRSSDIPVFIHEFQHVTDDLFHPKYLSRLQSLNKKGLSNNKYENFYEKYYYCPELIESKRDKKDVLKIIKNKTKNFLRGYNISEKMDFIQDIRYSLISEIKAYKKQEEIARNIQSKGILVKDANIGDYPSDGLFQAKINLLKNLALEYIKKERAKNNRKLL